MDQNVLALPLGKTRNPEKNNPPVEFFSSAGSSYRLLERALSGDGAAIQHLPAFENAHKKEKPVFFSRARILFFEART